MILFSNPLIFALLLTLVLQKRHRVDYGSNKAGLERMLVELDGGSDPAAGYKSEKAASFAVSKRSESSDQIDFAEPVESRPPSLTFKYWIPPPKSKFSER